jgi:hypothetical protein
LRVEADIDVPGTSYDKNGGICRGTRFRRARRQAAAGRTQCKDERGGDREA